MTAHDGSVRQRNGKSRFVTAILFATAAWLMAPALVPSFVPSSTTTTDNRPHSAARTTSPGSLDSPGSLHSPGPLKSPRSPATPRPLQTRPIESIRIGSRVLAENPEVDPLTRAARPEPDWRDWLWLSLEMPAPSGLSEFAPDLDRSDPDASEPDARDPAPSTLQIELLRPETWVRDQLRLITAPRVSPPAQIPLPLRGPLRPIYLDIDDAARRFAVADRVAIALAVDLDLPELGAAGTAWVTAVRPCPEVERAVGEVVTGTFTHPPAERVLDVRFEGEPDPIGVTANHPFWSVERRRFVPIDQIANGERVRTYQGETKRVEQKLPRPGPQAVHNLEVYGEHVYHVGQQGLLAHNNYARQGDVGAFSRIPESYMNPGLLVNMEPARGLSGSTLNSTGAVRNASWFWRQLVRRRPDIFSQGNLYRIERLGLSPRVDDTWVANNQMHSSYLRDVLHHHHIKHGPIAVPLPETVHFKWTSGLHTR